MAAYPRSMETDTRELTVAPGGDITLGADLLGHFNVAPGDKLELKLLPDGRAELRTKPDKGWDKVFGSIKYDGPPVSLEEIQATIARGWAGQL